MAADLQSRDGTPGEVRGRVRFKPQKNPAFGIKEKKSGKANAVLQSVGGSAAPCGNYPRDKRGLTGEVRIRERERERKGRNLLRQAKMKRSAFGYLLVPRKSGSGPGSGRRIPCFANLADKGRQMPTHTPHPPRGGADGSPGPTGVMVLFLG